LSRETAFFDKLNEFAKIKTEQKGSEQMIAGRENLKEIKLVLASIIWTLFGVTAIDFLAGILLQRSELVAAGYVFGILLVVALIIVRIAGLKLRELLLEVFH
jgi:hypothetical protein